MIIILKKIFNYIGERVLFMRLKRLILATALFTLSGSFVSMAGTWKKGISKPNDWWYDNGDGTYPYSRWEWLDGNNDGIAECYYFDAEGWMLANTTTPDGYSVNADGAWIEGGKVQVKSVSTGGGSNGGTGRISKKSSGGSSGGSGRSSSGGSGRSVGSNDTGGSGTGNSGSSIRSQESGNSENNSGSTGSNAIQNGGTKANTSDESPQVKELTDQGLTVDEATLYLAINAYRAKLGLSTLSFSKSLTQVARAHVQDSNNYHPERQVDVRGVQGNLHSWSSNGSWTPVVYTSDHLYADKMWSKPSELTQYTSPGFEISANAGSITPERALSLWMSSSAHNAVIIGSGQWGDLTTMGVGISGDYAHVWFGSAADPAGYYTVTQ